MRAASISALVRRVRLGAAPVAADFFVVAAAGLAAASFAWRAARILAMCSGLMPRRFVGSAAAGLADADLGFRPGFLRSTDTEAAAFWVRAASISALVRRVRLGAAPVAAVAALALGLRPGFLRCAGSASVLAAAGRLPRRGFSVVAMGFS